MAQDRNYRVFPNKLELLKFFGSYVPGLNVNASARMAPHMYVYEGKIMVQKNFPLFLRAMEELAGLDINEMISTQRGGSYIVFFDKPLPNPARRGGTVTATVKAAEAPEAVEEKPEQPADENPEGKVEIVTEEAPEINPTPEQNQLAPVTPTENAISDTIAAAEALNDESDKKGSKDKLADFAAAKGITLNKTKTFENMLADLKSAIGQ